MSVATIDLLQLIADGGKLPLSDFLLRAGSLGSSPHELRGDLAKLVKRNYVDFVPRDMESEVMETLARFEKSIEGETESALFDRLYNFLDSEPVFNEVFLVISDEGFQKAVKRK